MAKACAMATNFLRFCMACSDRLDLPLGAGAAGFDFVAGVGYGAGEGRIYTWSTEGATGSGYLVSWAVAVVSKSMGFG